MKVKDKPVFSWWFRLAVILPVLIFAHHWACTLMYNAPKKPWGNKVDRYVRCYMTPYFSQGWRLFAPNVDQYFYQLEYAYSNNGAWTNYVDVESLGGVAHEKRVHRTSQMVLRLLVMEMNRSGYVTQDEEVNDAATGLTSYHRIAFYAAKRHQKIHEAFPDSIQLRVKTIFAPEFGTGLTIDDRLFVFPPLAVAP